jgi:two-component system KDP operon response regulator KdpE
VTTILVVVDDHPLCRALAKGLGTHGFDVVTAMTGHEAIALASKTYPHLLIVDLGLPQLSGVEVVAAVRGWSGAPIIVISTRLQATLKEAALAAGADDFLMQPFGINELLVRITAALRRNAPSHEVDVVVTGELSIDLGSRLVKRHGETVRLTPKEWAILAALVRRRSDVVSERELLEQLWGPGYQKESAFLKIVVNGLRVKLEDDPAAPRHVMAQSGDGFRFNAA